MIIQLDWSSDQSFFIYGSTVKYGIIKQYIFCYEVKLYGTHC